MCPADIDGCRTIESVSVRTHGFGTQAQRKFCVWCLCLSMPAIDYRSTISNRLQLNRNLVLISIDFFVQEVVGGVRRRLYSVADIHDDVHTHIPHNQQQHLSRLVGRRTVCRWHSVMIPSNISILRTKAPLDSNSFPWRLFHQTSRHQSSFVVMLLIDSTTQCRTTYVPCQMAKHICLTIEFITKSEHLSSVAYDTMSTHHSRVAHLVRVKNANTFAPYSVSFPSSESNAKTDGKNWNRIVKMGYCSQSKPEPVWMHPFGDAKLTWNSTRSANPIRTTKPRCDRAKHFPNSFMWGLAVVRNEMWKST